MRAGPGGVGCQRLPRRPSTTSTQARTKVAQLRLSCLSLPRCIVGCRASCNQYRSFSSGRPANPKLCFRESARTAALRALHHADRPRIVTDQHGISVPRSGMPAAPAAARHGAGHGERARAECTRPPARRRTPLRPHTRSGSASDGLADTPTGPGTSPGTDAADNCHEQLVRPGQGNSWPRRQAFRLLRRLRLGGDDRRVDHLP